MVKERGLGCLEALRDAFEIPMYIHFRSTFSVKILQEICLDRIIGHTSKWEDVYSDLQFS